MGSSNSLKLRSSQMLDGVPPSAFSLLRGFVVFFGHEGDLKFCLFAELGIVLLSMGLVIFWLGGMYCCMMHLAERKALNPYSRVGGRED